MAKRFKERLYPETGTALVPFYADPAAQTAAPDDPLMTGMASIVAALTATETENAEASRADESTRALLARLNQLWAEAQADRP